MSFFNSAGKAVGEIASKAAEITQERRDFYERCKSMSDEQLQKVFCNDGFFGEPSWKREMAKQFWLKRGM
ncbi:hypothetical protein [Salinicola rhizosphaerae]|uniref:Uncharacterized protein n=1 Tax=Salinicola rhizosphaerae TaxID=1443141 RepID=A0ABQ3DPY4_9GAMM|nr:hypothetical protein [Salinicola rhizosphaerae]GHB08920.1 hypothetical protein GCM10009038_03050 [Salinicola rhizosphaerae]